MLIRFLIHTTIGLAALISNSALAQPDSLNSNAETLAIEWLQQHFADTIRTYKSQGFSTLQEVTEWPLEYEELGGEIINVETKLKLHDALNAGKESEERKTFVAQIDSLKSLKENYKPRLIGYHFVHTYQYSDRAGEYTKLLGFDFSPEMELEVVESVYINDRGMEMKGDEGVYYRK